MRWLLALLLPLTLSATERRPWFEPVLDPELELGYSYEWFGGVDRAAGDPHGYIHRAQGGMLFIPWPSISAELELGLAGSRQSGFFFDYVGFTGRTLLMDELDSYPASLSAGFSITFSSVTSRRDFATPWLGPIDLELHLAVGREFCGWRAWGWGGAALSRGGAPRLRGQLALEGCWGIGVATWGLLGLGKRDLFEIPHFRGYGPVQSRAVDVGLFYRWCGTLARAELEVRYRPYARNYPDRDFQISILIYLPFSSFL